MPCRCRARGPGGWRRRSTRRSTELEEAIRPRRGTWRDGAVAAVMLLAVVAASTVMERAATEPGPGISGSRRNIVTRAVVLAVVTSLPKQSRRCTWPGVGRGAAALSTALNSNALNVAAGLLLPATITGLGERSGQDVLVAAWYAGLTVVTLLLAYRGRGLYCPPARHADHRGIPGVRRRTAGRRGPEPCHGPDRRRCPRPPSPCRARCCWPCGPALPREGRIGHRRCLIRAVAGRRSRRWSRAGAQRDCGARASCCAWRSARSTRPRDAT